MVLDKATTYMTNMIFPGKRVLSNLPLQMGLYFNVVLIPVWIIFIFLFINKNYWHYDELYRYLSLTVVCIVVCVEMLRLYLGYEGNLKDKIPELAGFWMLSVLLQFPLQGFLLFNPYFQMCVTEIVVQSIMFILLCIQLVSGYCALKYTLTEQSKMVQSRKSEEKCRCQKEK
ncbi:transmembrane protein 17-like isoform X1 [Diorhabda sublineata]|uniref:transmembrane protein 17-like isoform X1 n=2 Tax=Diorhabda sublineata TaxID=1163346 RepID=UPI0024E168C5|nr:transmembrane protein 17-like isoform X1 [Diorhabda sublineata]